MTRACHRGLEVLVRVGTSRRSGSHPALVLLRLGDFPDALRTRAANARFAGRVRPAAGTPRPQPTAFLPPYSARADVAAFGQHPAPCYSFARMQMDTGHVRSRSSSPNRAACGWGHDLVCVSTIYSLADRFQGIAGPDPALPSGEGKEGHQFRPGCLGFSRSSQTPLSRWSLVVSDRAAVFRQFAVAFRHPASPVDAAPEMHPSREIL